MSDKLLEAVRVFLGVVADRQNWRCHEIRDKHGDYIGSYFTWELDTYDPQHEAADLLEKLEGIAE